MNRPRGNATGTKRCTHCGEVKPLDGFSLNRSSRDGRTSWCKDCCREKTARWTETRGAVQSAMVTRHKHYCAGCGKLINRTSTYCAECVMSYPEASLHGPKHWAWKGGRVINSNGHVLIWCPNHPNAHADGYVPKHRLIMEKLIGRYLTPSERVGHRNCVRGDNRVKNLILFPNPSEMMRYFQSIKRKSLTVLARRRG